MGFFEKFKPKKISESEKIDKHVKFSLLEKEDGLQDYEANFENSLSAEYTELKNMLGDLDKKYNSVASTGKVAEYLQKTSELVPTKAAIEILKTAIEQGVDAKSEMSTESLNNVISQFRKEETKLKDIETSLAEDFKDDEEVRLGLATLKEIEEEIGLVIKKIEQFEGLRRSDESKRASNEITISQN